MENRATSSYRQHRASEKSIYVSGKKALYLRELIGLGTARQKPDGIRGVRIWVTDYCKAVVKSLPHCGDE